MCAMCSILGELYGIILGRIDSKDPNSYTVKLVEKGKAYIARKLGEEAIEVILATLTESKERIVNEIADLVYHLMVLMVVNNITLDDVCNELSRRRK